MPPLAVTYLAVTSMLAHGPSQNTCNKALRHPSKGWGLKWPHLEDGGLGHCKIMLKSCRQKLGDHAAQFRQRTLHRQVLSPESAWSAQYSEETTSEQYMQSSLQKSARLAAAHAVLVGIVSEPVQNA